VAVKSYAPTGLGRRHSRLSDEETERRMLEAAIAMVHETGLTVSLDHLSFEDVIRDARVSRSTVYRRWPYKDLFFSDLLKELAKAATPAAATSQETTLPAIRRIVLEHLDWLDTAELRRDLLLELMRQGSLNDFETMLGSTEWRTYLALHATFLSVADAELRTQLQAALAQSEQGFIRRIASSWEAMTRLFGYRLRPELDATFESLATLLSADLRGHVIMALASPDVATRRFLARPFGATEVAEWSPPALAIVAIAFTFLEPDPAIGWDVERIATVREAFKSEDSAEPAALLSTAQRS
jgi:AcrR family transcriptional regulator